MEDIIIAKTKDIEYLQFKRLLEFEDDLIHAYTLKTYDVGFNQKFDRDNITEKSCERIADVLNIKDNCIIKPIQKHTDIIYKIECEDDAKIRC